MKRRRNPQRSPFVVLFAVCIGVLTVLACGTGQQHSTLTSQANDGGSPVIGQGACPTDGATRSCHVNLGQRSGVQQCFSGTQTCIAGQWTSCGGSGTVQSSALQSQSVSASGFHSEAVTSSAPLACQSTPSCTARTTCTGGLVCGKQDDGCGGILKCGAHAGACTANHFCLAGVCLPDVAACTAKLPSAACPGECGEASDGCTSSVICPLACPNPPTTNGTPPHGNANVNAALNCGGTGFEGTCPLACSPKTQTNACASVSCNGYVSDGCGGQYHCNSAMNCGGGKSCTFSNTTTAACHSNPCTTKTCATLGVSCGYVDDGCGGELWCNACPSGEQCVSGQCEDSCTAQTSAAACGAAVCGDASDGCGGIVSCGTCPTNQACFAGVCVVTACTAISGATAELNACVNANLGMGANCGNLSDGCLSSFTCPEGTGGTCSLTGQACLGNTCSPACTPTTCVAQGIACGYIDDGCGGVLDCGGCGAETCGGGGVPGQCGSEGCTPITNAVACATNTCGVVSDGCSGQYNCPMATGPNCTGGVCVGGIGLPTMMMGGMTGNACDPGGTITAGNAGGTFSCPSGSDCVLDCTAGGACTNAVTVQGGGSWTINCGSGSCTNTIDCTGGPTCIINCTGGGSCTNAVSCNASNNCEINCTGGGTCTNTVTCTGPDCDLSCVGNGSCTGAITETVGTGSGCVACTGSGTCTNTQTCTGTTCDTTAASCPCTGGGSGGGTDIICAADPCDPYCMESDMTNMGTLNPGSGAATGVMFGAGQVPAGEVSDLNHNCAGGSCGGTGGNLETTVNGLNGCSGTGLGANASGTVCATNPSLACQQDYSCNTSTDTCQWNGGSGSYNASAAGIDLTIGAACTSGANTVIPVCNRGSAATAALATININLVAATGPTPPDGCTPIAAPPDCTATAPAAGGLQPGQCMDVPCPAAGGVIGDDYAVVNAGGTTIPEVTPLCSNNAAYVDTTGGCSVCTTVTTISGTIYDPGVNVPLAGIAVFQPSGSLTAFPAKVACDSCSSLSSPALSSTSTNVDGTFSLQVYGTSNIPIVIQTGRWRREVTIGATAACPTCSTAAIAAGMDNPQPVCTTATAGSCLWRLPRSGSAAGAVACGANCASAVTAEGEIPTTAIVMGQAEAMECDIAQFMGGFWEFGPPGAGTQFTLYTDNGAQTATGSTSSSTLFSGLSATSNYDVFMYGCPGGNPENLSGTQQDNILGWTEVGGKVFADHHAGDNMFNGADNGISPFTTTSTWSSAGGLGSDQGVVSLNDTEHNVFKQWLTDVGAYGGGYVNTPQCSFEALVPQANAIPWLTGSSGGTHNLSFSWDMGSTGVISPGSPGVCGRAVYNSFHVESSRGSGGGTFPSECKLSSSHGGIGVNQTPDEDALEYLMYVLDSCSVFGPPVPPTPPPSGCENYQFGSGPQAFYSCQMDTYCDPLTGGGTGNCVPFSSGQTWAAPTPTPREGATSLGGVDLTVEQGCSSPSGGAYYNSVPICNRGTATLMPSMSLNGDIALAMFDFATAPANTSPLDPPGGCPTGGALAAAPVQCLLPIPVGGLAGGQCLLLDVATDCMPAQTAALAYDQLMFVNSNYDITEDTFQPSALLSSQPVQFGCANNWGILSSGNAPPACSAGSAYMMVSATYDYSSSTCPIGTHGQWALLTYDTTVMASSATQTGEVVFQVATQPVNEDGTTGAFTPYATVADVKGVFGGNNLGDPATCAVSGPLSTTPAGACTSPSSPPCCPKSIAAALEEATPTGLGLGPGTVAETNENLELMITINPSADGTQSATVTDWQVSFDCVPSE